VVSHVRTIMRGTGQFLITAGLVILLFCVYELYFTGFYTAREQSHLQDDLTQVWQQPGTREVPDVQLGHGIAVLRIPRLGGKYHKVIVEGVSRDDLRKGPGHLPETVLPGQLGNFVVSGHRTTYGAPFNRLDELRPGDAIILETKTTYYTYRETKEQIVKPTDVWVTEPVPGQPGASPTKKLLTFTTCNPKYSARQRLIIFAELVETTKKPGLPSVIISGGV
jgi:sortase A